LKPERVIETGVSEGRSSRALLSALQANSSGHLLSFDIEPEVGSLVETPLRARWTFHQLPGRQRSLAFEKALKDFAPIDLFFHDSHHTYGWQSLEYRLAWNSLAEGGFLTSDDVDSSFAFLDFCKRNSVTPDILVGDAKLFGAVRKPRSVPK